MCFPCCSETVSTYIQTKVKNEFKTSHLTVGPTPLFISISCNTHEVYIPLHIVKDVLLCSRRKWITLALFKRQAHCVGIRWQATTFSPLTSVTHLCCGSISFADLQWLQLEKLLEWAHRQNVLPIAVTFDCGRVPEFSFSFHIITRHSWSPRGSSLSSLTPESFLHAPRLPQWLYSSVHSQF